MRLTQRQQGLSIAIVILGFTLSVSAVGFWKYAHFRYNGLDLVIYTNVLWNLSHGEGWFSSIQGHSYLADHLEPILLAMVPLFRLWPDARLLIVLQAFILGCSAVPVFLLIRNAAQPWMTGVSAAEVGRTPADTFTRPGEPRSLGSLGRSSSLRSDPMPAPLAIQSAGVHPSPLRTRWAVLFACLWLLNPILWNAALFEFHAIAFAPVVLLSAAYAYVRRRFGWFMVWLLLACAVREDVALIVAMFGVVEAARWLGPRRFPFTRAVRWAVAPFLLGTGWFLIATRIVGAHNPNGAYAFLIYYGWLGDSFGSIVGNALAHPIRVLRHLLRIGNLDMALGLLVPFLGLPLLAPRWLLLTVPPLLTAVLGASGGSNLIVELHYGLLFLPGLTLAGIAALSDWRRDGPWNPDARPKRRGSACIPAALRIRRFLEHHVPLPRSLAMTLVVGMVLGSDFLIGPFAGVADIVVRGAHAEDRMRRAAYGAILSQVPPDAPVAATYGALPHLAARRDVASLSYVYLGVSQYARERYPLPPQTTHLVIDARDILAFALQFPRVGWAAPHAAGAPERFRARIADEGFRVATERDDVSLLVRGVDGPLLDVRFTAPDTSGVDGALRIDDLRDIRLEAVRP